MTLKRALIGFGLLSSFLLAACSNQAAVSVQKIVDFEKETDLSIYYVSAPEIEEIQPVELNPSLEYIDTSYMMKLKKAAGETSASRTTYSQYAAEWDFVLIDSRPANVFAAGHINGAINIPDSQFEQFITALPDDKSKQLIFYCGGWHCELSSNSALKAKELGYENIRVYQEGTPAWTAAGNYLTVTSDYVKDQILEVNVTNESKKPIAILDVRPYDMYFKSHIPNSTFADDTLFSQKFKAITPQDKSTEVIIYCGGFNCLKSHTVATHLVNSGYTNIKVYSGGLPEWISNGFPTFGTNSGGGTFDVSEGKIDRGLTPEVFVQKLTTTENVFVLDVRGAAEIANGMIPGAVNIPDGDIHADPTKIVGKLPTDKNTTILIHCASGARAGGVVNKIVELGYPNAYYLNHAIKVSSDGAYSFP